METFLMWYLISGIITCIISIPDFELIYKAAKEIAVENNTSVITEFAIPFTAISLIYLLGWPWVLILTIVHRGEEN